MQISQQKLQENIAEYILYMYQIEDIIRACNFDIDVILNNYVKPQLPDDSFIGQYTDWYKKLISEMKANGIQKEGHLASLQEIMIEMSYLHNTLINMTKDQKYIDIFEAAAPFIEEFKEKSDLKNMNQIEVAFHALYMKLLLKLQKRKLAQKQKKRSIQCASC